MTEIKRPVNSHRAYHAHVYFEAETVEFASDLCTKAGELFPVKVGRVHQKLVGPHPKWSCQIKFTDREFEQLLGWLDEKRNGLSVLVHALSGDELEDHTIYAYWLGDPVPLDLTEFQ